MREVKNPPAKCGSVSTPCAARRRDKKGKARQGQVEGQGCRAEQGGVVGLGRANWSDILCLLKATRCIILLSNRRVAADAAGPRAASLLAGTTGNPHRETENINETF